MRDDRIFHGIEVVNGKVQTQSDQTLVCIATEREQNSTTRKLAEKCPKMFWGKNLLCVYVQTSRKTNSVAFTADEKKVVECVHKAR